MTRVRQAITAAAISAAALVSAAPAASAAPVVFTVSNGGSDPVGVKAVAIPGILNVSVKSGCGSMAAKDLDPTAVFVVCLPGGATLIFGLGVT